MKKQKEYIFMWSQTPIMPSYWATAQAFKERSDIYQGGEKFSYYDGRVITTYVPKNEIELRKKKESKRYTKPAFFKKYQLRYHKEKKEWWGWIRRVEKKDYSNVTISQLREDQEKFQEYMRDSIAYFGSTRPEFTYQAEQKLEKILKKYFEDEWKNVFGALVNALKLDDVQKEHLERLKLLSAGITNKKLLSHVSKFPWLVADYLEEKKALSFLRKIFNKEKKDYQKEKNRLKNEKRKLKEKQEKIYGRLNKKDEKEARYLASFLQIQSVERMNVKSYWIGCYYLARNMWYKIAEIIELKIDDIFKFVTPPEIQQLLNGKYKGDINKIIKLRKKSYAISYESGGKIEIFTYKKADKLFEEKIKKPSTKSKVIKGQAASLGIYKGKVRKVIIGDLEMLQESIKRFKEGEVLVTSMTQPNMMVIARRAGAIIADEGGITSHAAIISRELKIPCIVGCLKAMQVLKDGDLVEVNANRGLVRLLERRTSRSVPKKQK